MKISTKGRYGLRIVLDLVMRQSGSPRLLRDIAESQQLSEKYLSRLMVDLRRAGLVHSIRGAKGGFRIAKKAEEITLLDVVEAMEGPLSIIDCVADPDNCDRHDTCVTRDIWGQLNADIRANMSKVTVQDIIKNYQQQITVASDYII